MNREIKFRGWHVQNQRMFSAEEMEVDQLTLLTTGSFINVHGMHTHLSTIYDRDKFIPMQYTGLKDKNGKEIYEGDIVRLFYGHESWIKNAFEIVFQVHAFALKRPEKKGSTALATYIFDCLVRGIITDSTNDETKLFEVIGNIHENPELLQS